MIRLVACAVALAFAVSLGCSDSTPTPSPTAILVPTDTPAPTEDPTPTPAPTETPTPTPSGSGALVPIDATDYQSFMGSISDAEGACLAKSFEPDRLKFIISEGLDIATDEAATFIECLERETLLRMVLDTALSATGPLSGEPSECIRGGIAGPVADAMNSLFLPSPRSEDEDASLLAVLFLALAGMNEEECNAAVQIAGGLIPEDWSFMQCTVDAVGPTDVAALFLGSVDQEDLSPKEQSALEGCLASADPFFPTTPTPSPPTSGPLADLVWDTAVMLARDLRPRESSTQEELRAAEYLAGQFSRWGYEVQVQEFETIDHGGCHPSRDAHPGQDRGRPWVLAV